LAKKGVWAGVAIFVIKTVAGLVVLAYAFQGWNQKNVRQNLVEADPDTFVQNSLELKLSRQTKIGSEWTDQASADQILSLPGLSTQPSYLQFSGYLDVSETKHNFYWFTESENDPDNDPLIIWTNGGPGCSGFIGFMGEMGPFRPQEDLSLLENSMAWNKIANMVYIEQPCGVGFSYSDNPNTDYFASDATAATDNLQLVLQFLKRYPHLKTNKLYLSGESYGGHYLPTWATEIVQYNEQADADSQINFAGFLVGNPYTDPDENIIGMVGTFWGHQLVPHDLFEQWLNLGCRTNTDSSKVGQCMDLTNSMFDLVDEMDPYALDYDVCISNNAQGVGQSQRDKLTSYIHDGRFQSRRSKFLSLQIIDPEDKQDGRKYTLNNFKVQDTFGTEPVYQPCATHYMTKWINQDSVKDAIHANPTLTWSECSDKIHYHYSDQHTPMEPLYKALLEKRPDLNIMVFSGDDDSVCGTIGTQSWMWNLGYPVTKQWSSWKHNGQVAGFEVRFAGIRFATVHGAGHEVPAFKPSQSLQLLQGFLEQTDLDSTVIPSPSKDVATINQ